MTLKEVVDRLAPDLTATLKRFPFAILLLAGTAILALIALNAGSGLDEEFWWRLVLGFATGAVTATAGSLFAESRPDRPALSIVLGYVLPVLAILALQVTDTRWLTPYLIPIVSILWLSVSAFTRRDKDQQDRFWWLNHQGAATALIAVLAFLLIALGILVIERSLSILFGLEAPDLFYRWVLPVIGLFFTPLYWLSTLPRLEKFDEGYLTRPDFIARAIGFLGQFVLTPLLLAYSLILLAYMVQIVVLRHLPQGILGWMVLAFVVTGAANWLLLHPAFMRERLLVRLFRRYWFWLTIVPLILYGLAVFVRVDAYGLTPERMLLVAGGAWGALLTLVFLIRRGDIRLIPALAGVILLVVSVGPWNFQNLPIWQQASRLDAVLTETNLLGATEKPDWTNEQAADVRSAISYLAYHDEGREALNGVLEKYGFSLAENGDPSPLLAQLGVALPEYVPPSTTRVLNRDMAQGVDVSATPTLIGVLALYADGDSEFGPLKFSLAGPSLATSEGTVASTVDLVAFAESNADGTLTDPIVAFALGGVQYAYVVDTITIDTTESDPKVLYASGTLFSAAMPTP
jgi:hypothetical protein